MNSFADGISTWKVPACECFVNDTRVWSAPVIVSKRSARDDWQLQRVGSRRTDDLQIGLWSCSVWQRWRTGDIERRPADLRTPSGSVVAHPTLPTTGSRALRDRSPRKDAAPIRDWDNANRRQPGHGHENGQQPVPLGTVSRLEAIENHQRPQRQSRSRLATITAAVTSPATIALA